MLGEWGGENNFLQTDIQEAEGTE